MSKVLVKLSPTPEKQERPGNRQEEVQETLSSSFKIMDDTTKRPRRTSSNTSQEESRKKVRIGSRSPSGGIIESEDEEDSDFSDEEFNLHLMDDAPEWARAMMVHLKNFTKKIHTSCSALNTKLNSLTMEMHNIRRENEKEKAELVTNIEFMQGKVNDLKHEDEKLSVKVKQLEQQLEIKTDELEQYSRRECIVITGIPESKQEDTRAIVNDFCRDKLGVELMQGDLARTHRLGSKKEDVNGKMINRPIIAKFATYEVRDLVFKSKRKLKDSGHAIFESLTTRNTKLYNEVKSIAGYKNAWTHDGKVMTIDKDGKIFRVVSKKRFPAH